LAAQAKMNANMVHHHKRRRNSQRHDRLGLSSGSFERRPEADGADKGLADLPADKRPETDEGGE
jgi:hypothetical protein